jgi:succinyl-CoA synthetase beta subunit
MKLIEADAKDILERHGLPVPRGRALLRRGDAAPMRPDGGVVKAQVARGGRGKMGLVAVADGPISDAVDAMFDKLAAQGEKPLVLVEDRVAIAREYYLAWSIDDVLQCPVLMASPHGGVDVESHPERVARIPVGVAAHVEPYELIGGLLAAGFEGRVVGAVARFASSLHRVFSSEDALLVEINPLAMTAEGTVVALDCKMVLDGYASHRHGDRQSLVSNGLHREAMTPLEAEADRMGFTFVDMAGEVAIVSGGAGLGMALVDMFGEAGHPAANFCDLLGGSGEGAFRAMIDAVFKRAAQPDVKVVAAYFTLSATPLKGAVAGLLGALDAHPLSKPLVVGFGASASAEQGMTVEQARAEFARRGYTLVDDPAALVETATRLIVAG